MTRPRPSPLLAHATGQTPAPPASAGRRSHTNPGKSPAGRRLTKPIWPSSIPLPGHPACDKGRGSPLSAVGSFRGLLFQNRRPRTPVGIPRSHSRALRRPRTIICAARVRPTDARHLGCIAMHLMNAGRICRQATGWRSTSILRRLDAAGAPLSLRPLEDPPRVVVKDVRGRGLHVFVPLRRGEKGSPGRTRSRSRASWPGNPRLVTVHAQSESARAGVPQSCATRLVRRRSAFSGG